MLIGRVIQLSSRTRWTDGREHIILDVRDVTEGRKEQHVGELTLPNDEDLMLDAKVEITLKVIE